MRTIGLLAMLVAACATIPRVADAPAGATIEPSGFATVLIASPAPYSPPPKVLAGWVAPPGEIGLPTDDVEILQYRWERGIPLAQARAEILQLRAEGPEARAVEARANAAEPDNFVQIGIQRVPVAAWTFAFKRDPERSLRRYTSNPRFVAKRLPFTAAEAAQLWGGEQIAGGGGYTEPIDDADRARLISQCGNHAIVDLYSPASKVNWDKYARSQYARAP